MGSGRGPPAPPARGREEPPAREEEAREEEESEAKSVSGGMDDQQMRSKAKVGAGFRWVSCRLPWDHSTGADDLQLICRTRPSASLDYAHGGSHPLCAAQGLLAELYNTKDVKEGLTCVK